MWPFGRKDDEPMGRRGERLAAGMLRRKGMKILAHNYRCPAGEIDLIALDRSTRRDMGAETIVFAEVKTRSSGQYAAPESAVNAEKRRHIRRAAHYYLAHRPTEDYNVRYDIVSIVVPSDGHMQIKHIVDAF